MVPGEDGALEKEDDHHTRETTIRKTIGTVIKQRRSDQRSRTLEWQLFTGDGEELLEVVGQVAADELEVEDVQLEPEVGAVELVHDLGS